jgi:ketosteroid isomerase-like protein
MGNLEVARSLRDAFSRKDPDGVLALLAPGFVFVPQRAAVQGEFVGEAGLREFFADNEDSFEVFEPEPGVFEEHGDKVLWLGRIHVRGKGSGVDTSVPSAIVIWLRDGKITRFEDFVEEGKARAAL